MKECVFVEIGLCYENFWRRLRISDSLKISDFSNSFGVLHNIGLSLYLYDWLPGFVELIMLKLYVCFAEIDILLLLDVLYENISSEI